MTGGRDAVAAEAPPRADVPAEMTAALANMLEAALAAGLVPAPAGQAPPARAAGGRR